jgi:hypothetical protein
MKLHRHKRRGTILVAVMIAYYILASLWLLRHGAARRHQQPEYYGMGAQTISYDPGPDPHWGGRTVCGPNGCVTVPDTGSLPVVVGQQGLWWGELSNGYYALWNGRQQVGGYYPDRSAYLGYAYGRWSDKPSEPPIPLPDSAGKVIGADDKPTGVNKEKLAESKINVPSGYTVNGIGITEADAKQKLSNAAKAAGLKDFDNFVRVSVIGNDSACQPFMAVVENQPKLVREKILADKYDPARPEDAHHIKAHLNSLRDMQDVAPGQCVAFVQFADGTTPAIATTPDELKIAIGQLRPDHADGFDPNKARVGFKTSNQIMLISLLLLLGGVPLIVFASRPPSAPAPVAATHETTEYEEQ